MKGKHGELLRDGQPHQMLLRQIGVHKISKEQKEIKDQIMGATDQLTLENENPDPDCTLDLPILQRLEKSDG